MLRKISLTAFLIVIAACLGPAFGRSNLPALTVESSGGGSYYQGNFYIISSVNLKSHEVFLKTPTEVTELMLVNDQTEILDQTGKRIALNDLRAGNTVYVASQPQSASDPVAARIQIGPMTAAILHDRYQKL